MTTLAIRVGYLERGSMRRFTGGEVTNVRPLTHLGSEAVSL